MILEVMEVLTQTLQTCYHCGEDCPEQPLVADDHSFCCRGCHTVYDILKDHDMTGYYDLEKSPGTQAKATHADRWAYLDHEEVQGKLLDFTDGKTNRITFFIPAIHCSSCIWLLENLHHLEPQVRSSMVNFTKKEVSITWSEQGQSLRQLVELLDRLGYPPEITLDKGNKKKVNRSFYVKLGVAGFCFGNIMMLSLPEYLDTKNLVEEQYHRFFSYLNLLLALPVVFYAATDYYRSAWSGLRFRQLSLDLTISLGIITIFVRSAYEILSQTGPGYMDSLSGLVFFLLIGKWYQSKTYAALGFERDYHSYFPVAATRMSEGREESVLLKDLKTGDRILIRNQELIPADAVLLKGEGKVDYAFVTGESEPTAQQSGDLLYAGGRQVGGVLEVELRKQVQESYLTQLWNQEVFRKEGEPKVSSLVRLVGQYFTLGILLISLGTAAYWYVNAPAQLWNTVTAVLIVACPCALALVIPFAFGNVMRVLGRWGLYLKSTEAVEELAAVDTLVFDKTGTITHKGRGAVSYTGTMDGPLATAVRSLVRNSTHPLSQMLYTHLESTPLSPVEDFEEEAGQGIKGRVRGIEYCLGSAQFTGAIPTDSMETRVYISQSDEPIGYYSFTSQYRQGLESLLGDLRQQGYGLHLLSGDNDRERGRLQGLFDELHFHQQPMDKLQYLQRLRAEGKRVLMVGDGLNDAGALKESHVGISVSDDIYHFSPACDIIMDSRSFGQLLKSIRLAKSSMRVVYAALLFSLLYNVVGLSFAISGQLSPIVCAILMPLSSVTVVGFVTLGVMWLARNKS